MTDLYKHLDISEAATRDEIRAAAAKARPEIGSAAKSILLDEHRRRVYDRNRRLLATVGQLRSRLGLSFSPFWMRGQFADFTFDVVPGLAGSGASNGQHLANPLEVLRAFNTTQAPTKAPRRRRKRRSKAHKWLIILSAVLLAIVLAVVVIVWWKWSQYVTF